eukprot:10031980-Karenia_brevis.AAC.1
MGNPCRRMKNIPGYANPIKGPVKRQNCQTKRRGRKSERRIVKLISLSSKRKGRRRQRKKMKK